MTSSKAPTRDRLIQAAIRLFTSQAYDAVSVRALAAAAHVNLGAVTYHFGSKQALYHAAIESMSAPLRDLVTSVLASSSAPLDKIETLVRGALDLLLKQPGAPVILLRELADDKPLPPPIAQLMRRNIGALATIIAEGQRDGSIRAGDPPLLAITVMSQPFFVRAAHRLIRTAVGVDPGAADQQTRITDHVLTSVRRAIASHPDAPQ